MEPVQSDTERRGQWWQRRLLLFLIVFASAVPLLIPGIPALIDLPGHMGRYRVQLDIDASPYLDRFYNFEWMLIGNLGVDLLVIPMASMLPLELAVKLIVLAIPPLTVAGFLWVAREVHGRIPPTAFFAIPFAYGYPFLFGFLNFALSMALAFLAFGLWLHLARLDRLRLRAAIFLPLSVAIWVVHAFGWGTLGVLAFSAELVRQIDLGRSLISAGLRSALHCVALTPPVALMLLWRSGHVTGQTADWFNWEAKWRWLLWSLRDRWEIFDLATLGLIVLLLLRALWSPRIAFSRNLVASALFLTLVFVALPRIVFGSAYADMRLVPYMLAVFVIAIRLKPRATAGFANMIAVVALIFVGVRLAGVTASFWLYDRSYDRQLAALDRIPVGARLAAFVGRRCKEPWAHSRLEHLPAVATVRRQAFSNDQWTMAGAQLLSVDYPEGGRFVRDPSQMVTPVRCRGEAWLTIEETLRHLPRGAFDYVWLIQPPPYNPALTQGMEPLWRNGTSIVYRIVERTPPSAAPPPRR